MKKFFYLSAMMMLFTFPGALLAQHSLQLQGIVYDSLTHKPAKYVNIGILEKGIGTVSSDSGRFNLTIPADRLNDSLTFSRIGYQAKKLPIAHILKEKSFLISREAISLHEVKVTSKKMKTKVVGNNHRKGVSFVVERTSLGKELGMVVKLPDKPVFIKDFSFYITYNRPDSVKFRLNIYSYNKHNGQIGKNLLHRNIYITVPGTALGGFKVNLEKYNIVVNGDIVVAMEMVAMYLSKGPDPNKKADKYFYDRLYIAGTFLGSKTFIREVSLDTMKKTSPASVSYKLTVAY